MAVITGGAGGVCPNKLIASVRLFSYAALPRHGCVMRVRSLLHAFTGALKWVS